MHLILDAVLDARPVALLNAVIAGKHTHCHTAREKAFGYRAYRSEEELTKNYRRLWENEIYPNLKNGLSAVIYTQVSDIEEEVNGIFTYDREIVKLKKEAVCELNQRLYDEYEALTT